MAVDQNRSGGPFEVQWPSAPWYRAAPGRPVPCHPVPPLINSADFPASSPNRPRGRGGRRAPGDGAGHRPRRPRRVPRRRVRRHGEAGRLRRHLACRPRRRLAIGTGEPPCSSSRCRCPTGRPPAPASTSTSLDAGQRQDLMRAGPRGHARRRVPARAPSGRIVTARRGRPSSRCQGRSGRTTGAFRPYHSVPAR